jgi:hypothetical protein
MKETQGAWSVVYDSRVKAYLVFGFGHSLRSYEQLVDENMRRNEAYRLADDLNLVRDVNLD